MLSDTSSQSHLSDVSSQSESIELLHFTIDRMPSFLSPDTRFILTEESKRAFEAGKPKQGYIGLAELPDPENLNEDPSTVKIHLIPAFNKNDGLLRTDKSNNSFTGAVESIRELGSFTGDLHTFSAAKLGLGNKAGINGLLFGFGVWKSGIGVKFLEELPNKEARIRNEYLLVLNSENQQWEVYFIDDELNYHQAKSLPETLHLKINNLPMDFKQLNRQERIDIEDEIRAWAKEKHNNHGEAEGNIGFAKNRSSSQNQFSCHYTENYRNYFNDPNTIRGNLKGSAHSFRLPRELPLLVFQTLLDEITCQLDIAPVTSLTTSSIIPASKAGGPRKHFVAEAAYMEKTLENAIKVGNISFVEMMLKKHPEKNNLDNLILAIKHGNADVVMLFFSNKTGNYKVSPILLAIEEEQFEIAEMLIKAGADPNKKNQYQYNDNTDGKSPLIAAIAKGKIELVNLLILSEVKLNKPDGKGRTPLVYAIEEEQFEIAKILIEAGADPNQENQYQHNGITNGKSPLIAAIEKSKIEFINLLITSKVKLNKLDGKGRAPLVYAIEKEQFEIAKILIKAGADPNILDKSGFYDKPPLKAAIKAKNIELVKYLLDKGANINRFSKGKTPLATAIKAGNIDVANLLLERGADLTKIDERKNSHYRETCLMMAIKNADMPMVKWLIEHDAIDLSATDNQGNNAFHILAEHYGKQQQNDIKDRLIDIAILLLNNPKIKLTAEVLQRKNKNNGSSVHMHKWLSPLHIAVKNCSQDLVTILLSHPEINVDQKTEFDYTALYIATLNSDYKMVELLLAKNADINSQHQYNGNRFIEKKTPLMFAVANKDHKMVKLLLEHGASADIQDAYGRSVLFYAAMKDPFLGIQIQDFNWANRDNVDKKTNNSESLDILILLLKSNVDINLQDENGNTPLMFLIKESMQYGMISSKDMVAFKLLLDYGANVTTKNKDGKTALSLLRSCNVSKKHVQQKNQLIQLLEQAEKQAQPEGQQSMIGYLGSSLGNLFSGGNTLTSNEYESTSDSKPSYTSNNI